MASIAAPAPGRAAIEVPQRGLLTLAVMMATVMQILDTTIANVAVPHMQTSLSATSETVTWVLTSYIIASAIAFPITGWLADRLGSRNLFIGTVAVFVLASMLCGLAQNLEEMVLFRVIQGISAAFIGPLAQTVLLDINPPEKQARAMSIWGMGIMIGPIMGPVIGGWLTESYNWRWVFYVNLPVGIVTLALLWALLPSRPAKRRRFDLFGFSMLALGLAALQLMLDRGGQEDWLESWEIWIEGGIAIAAVWIFGVHMATAKNPLFDRRMFANINFVTCLFFMAVTGVVMFASMALLPPMLQHLFGYSVYDTGLLLAPRGFGVLVSMVIAGRLQGKVDPRYLVGTGMLIVSYSLWLMSQWSLDMDYHAVVTSGLVQGIGMGLVFIPLNLLAFASLGAEHRTDGASLMNLFRNIGSSVGISLVTTYLARKLQTSHQDLAGHITGTSVSMIDAGTADRLGQLGESVLSIVDAEVNRQALMIAYIDDFHMMMLATLIAIPLVILLRPPKPGADAPMMME